jgi:hypothetical protein
LVPNADEAERQRLPGGGASVRLSWAPEHIHLVRESAAVLADPDEVTALQGQGIGTKPTATSQGDT